MALTIHADTIVYLMCPANIHSGGPELMHQLCACLTAQGVRALMYYYNQTQPDPVDPFYKSYGTSYAQTIEDDEKHILVLSETALSAYHALHRIRKVVWWLSVDHYIQTMTETLTNHLAAPLDKPMPAFYDFHFDRAALHLVQSEYARLFLKANDVPDEEVAYLGDYLNAVFLQNAAQFRAVEKRDYVVYNPKKGADFTAKIIAQAPEIKFLPIQNLTPDQVRLLLMGGKVYIDFGYHPGKDRIPREAAACGCVVITGKKGAAGNDIDVPIPKMYKFDDTDEAIPAIVARIQEAFADFPAHAAAFDAYRERIFSEQNQFEADARRIFIRE